MTHKIYVGNYPFNFVEDDVLNLFQDYEGVELQRFLKKDGKCYSFLHCISERQLIEIVATLHDIDVCGRNLIVRAADENFQRKIEKSLSRYDSVNLHPKNTCKVKSPTSNYKNNGVHEHSETIRSTKPSPPKIRNNPKKFGSHTHVAPSTTPNSLYISEETDAYNDRFSDDYESHYHPSQDSSDFNCPTQQNYHHSNNSFGGARAKTGNSYHQDFIEPKKESGIDLNPQETFAKHKTDGSGQCKTMSERFDSYKSNPAHGIENQPITGHRATDKNRTRNRNSSESSVDTVHNKPSEDYENLSFISVINFPLRMPKRDLYELFAEFNPIKVFIVCNEPRVDKAPTEAIICFESENEATDAILTLDNTVYQGRAIIVTDSVDMSLVSELLSFS